MNRLSNVARVVRRAILLAAATALVSTSLIATPAAASTSTVTTLDLPAGQQYGSFTVTAHVRPAPQPANGFIPAVNFLVDGNLSGVAPLDGTGDGSTDLTLPVGSHSIVASFDGFDSWDASASAPEAVTVGIATTVQLSSSLNPALSSQPVTITAVVAPASGALSGGTLSIVDAFDGSTIASRSVGALVNSVSVTRIFAPGSHPLTANYTGHEAFGPSSASLGQSILADTAVNASSLAVAYSTFYPVIDNYRDVEFIRGRLNEPASVVVRIYSPAGSLIKTVNLGLRDAGEYTVSWNGRNSAGTILAAGTYRIVQRLTDTVANVKEATFSVALSHKKLSWTSATITRYGSQYSASGHGGTGFVSLSKSPYYRGVRISSGSGWASVRYSFTLHSAVAYSNLTLRVLGKSPNARQVIEGLWNPNYGTSLDTGNYDGKLIGPSYGWWSITLPQANHRSGQAVRGEVLADNDAGFGRKFDIAKVQLVYRWAVLV
jgi:flagellar hook capping protein FlgD/Big-like domain-containing protein